MTAIAHAPGGRHGAGYALADLAGQLYARGWMEGTAGNVSIRLTAGNRALITASGLSKGSLTSRDVVEVRVADGTAVAPGSRPSAETSIHTALYRAFPDCGAVLHAHPPQATAVAALADRRGADAVEFVAFEIIKGLGVADPSAVRVPVLANHPDVPRIAEDVTARLDPDAPPALLIGSHGATTWGPTLEAARNRMECLETLCRLTLMLEGH
ncbi:MAG TPA: methylthioribulose 1-phosphate dehydratase [Mycobacteriales bacterium]|nr:methylthioribulose 1-phosphate dehydratase [Mycobacteriales bacterium]